MGFFKFHQDEGKFDGTPWFTSEPASAEAFVQGWVPWQVVGFSDQGEFRFWQPSTKSFVREIPDIENPRDLHSNMLDDRFLPPDQIDAILRYYEDRSLLNKTINYYDASDRVSQNERVFSKIAAHPGSSAATLEKLQNHKSKEILQLLARNANASQATLLHLARSAVPEVRRALSENQGMTENLGNVLAVDTDLETRNLLAWNRRVSPAVLDMLANDSWRKLHATVATRGSVYKDLLPETWHRLAGDEDSSARYHAARHVSSVEDMAVLAEDPVWTVRVELTKNPNITEDLLIKLSTHKDDQVRQGVASSQNATSKLLTKLSHDK